MTTSRGIYRAPGGVGDAVADTSNESVTAVNAAAEALASKIAAELSASNAANSASAASTSATSAASSASAASTFTSNASTSATNASNSATAAQTAETNAETAQTAAEAAQAAAELAQTNAETAETNAETAETNAETAATNAASSASAAATSASNASLSASSASSSASAASTSATNAASSASAASTSASNASSSASSAASSASTATTQATNAASSASAASTSETNASNSASAASTSATNASNSASSASTSATNAASAQTAAEAARDQTLTAFDNFDDRYLGTKSSDPSVDNDGNALIAGALYFNSSSGTMKVYDGTQWLAAYASLSGALIATNNLSDVSSTSSARTNLGLGTAATTDSTAYATAAQGTNADSAYGWGNHASAGYLTSYTETDPIYTASSWYTTTNNASNWNTAYGWGNHASAGYQAGDANLTSFVNTFTLPTTDGTADQVMKTDGAGNIAFGTVTTGDAYVGSTNTFTANQIISVTDNTNAALRVTQLGTGDALRVEDSSNPDSTPFIVKNDGWVGIGVATPSYPLDITQLEANSRIYSTQAGKGAMRLATTTTGTMYVGKDYEGSSGWWGSGGEYVIAGTGNYPIDFHTNSVKRMSILGNGNVNFAGTGQRITGRFGSTPVADRAMFQTNIMNDNSNVGVIPNGTAQIAQFTAFNSSDPANASSLTMQVTPSLATLSSGATGTGTVQPLSFVINSVERGRFDTSGNFFLGKTSINYRSVGIQTENTFRTFGLTSNINSAMWFASREGVTGDFHSFYYNGASVGNIATNGSTTSYNTSSDYRLKENVKPMAGALAKVAQLKPVTYNWIVDGSDGQGFIAHELQEVIPDAVTGEKDALDEKGNPKYQGVDSSFLVATLTAAIQELKAELDVVKAELNALKGN